MILWEDDFQGAPDNTDLSVYDPNWEHLGGAGRYVVMSGGFASATFIPNLGDTARYPFQVPDDRVVRFYADCFKESGDTFSGNGLSLMFYYPSGALAREPQTSSISLSTKRQFGGVTYKLSVVQNRPGNTSLELFQTEEFSLPLNSGKRFGVEIDTALATIRVFISDFGTGANEVDLGSTAIPALFLSRAPADRLIGFEQSRNSAALNDWQIFYMAVEADATEIVPILLDRLFVGTPDLVDPLLFPLPYSVATDGSAGVVQIATTDGEVLPSTRPTATSIRLVSTPPAGQLEIGIQYEMLGELSTIYYRNADYTGIPRADSRKRLQLHRIRFRHQDTRSYEVLIQGEERSEVSYPFSSASADDGEVSAAVLSNNEQVSIKLRNLNPVPCWITGMQWDGIFKARTGLR